jgi:hypothetical protein
MFLSPPDGDNSGPVDGKLSRNNEKDTGLGLSKRYEALFAIIQSASQ